MYLNLLSYQDKKLFFALANRIVNVDGVITDSEIELLEAFRNEMNLIDVDYLAESEFDEIVDHISDDKIVRKIILFELITLVNVDSDISDKELELLSIIKGKWSITDDLYKELKNLVEDLVDVTNRLTEIILK